MKKTLLVFAVLFALRAEAGAAWMKEEFAFGSGKYISENIGVYHAPSTATVMGAEFGFYKYARLKEVVYAFRFPWLLRGEKGMTILTPFHYPSTGLVKTSAIGLRAQHIFELPRGNDPDITSRASFGVAAASQHTEFDFAGGGKSTKQLPQLVYEAQFQQDYFKEFYFLMSASAYQYLTSVRGQSLPYATLNQADLSTLGLMAAETRFPLWSAGIDFTRTTTEDPNSSAFLGYHFIEYHTNTPCAHALKIGMHMKIANKSTFNFSYNWIAAGKQTKRNFYHAYVRVNF